MLPLLKGEFTLNMSLSESSVKLLPSEPESFTFSLILSVQKNVCCEVFFELDLGPGIFHWAGGALNIS
jgi:hypothetical protein